MSLWQHTHLCDLVSNLTSNYFKDQAIVTFQTFKENFIEIVNQIIQEAQKKAPSRTVGADKSGTATFILIINH